MKQIQTMPELLAALGGANAVARWLGLRASDVQGWPFVPRIYALHVIATLTSNGINPFMATRPSLFGLASWSQIIGPSVAKKRPRPKLVK